LTNLKDVVKTVILNANVDLNKHKTILATKQILIKTKTNRKGNHKEIKRNPTTTTTTTTTTINNKIKIATQLKSLITKEDLKKEDQTNLKTKETIMLRILKNNSYKSIILLILLISCDSKRVFDEYTSMPNGYWDASNKASFNFSVTDTITKQNLYINLRNNNSFPFSNLFLITELKFPDGHEIIDTLEYDMTDKAGKFLGTGFSEIKENKLFYKEHITFPKKGNYAVTIAQAMRKSNEVNGIKALAGITDLGFRIEKIE